MKIEDRSQEETESQERCARGDAWRLAKNILKLKDIDKATFFSPANEWSLPAPSAIKPEERESVVDSGASMHMLSRKDLNSAEVEIVEVSKSQTTVVTANGEVQTKDEATVYVKENWIYLGQQCFSKIHRQFSLTRKTLRRSRISLRVDQWSETTTHQRWQTNKMQHCKLRTDRCPWSIDRLFKLSYSYISDIFIARSRNSHTASRINKKREYEWHRKSTGKTCRVDQQKSKIQITMKTTKSTGRPVA